VNELFQSHSTNKYVQVATLVVVRMLIAFSSASRERLSSLLHFTCDSLLSFLYVCLHSIMLMYWVRSNLATEEASGMNLVWLGGYA